jgi:hypothetical protein
VARAHDRKTPDIPRLVFQLEIEGCDEGEMDGVEGMLRGLKLSEAERARVKVGGAGLLRRRGGEDEKAVGKLLSEKQAHAGAIADTLGPIWCPMKGVCKDLGENKFLFTFFQEGGRKKAVEEGPWTFDKALIVMESFDPCKTLDEYKFAQIPIWVRIYKLPLGLMDRDTCMHGHRGPDW